jgi:epsilon-lactone hydrolase
MTLPPERAGHAAPADLIARRTELALAVAAGYWRTELEPEQVEIGGIRCLRFTPPTEPRGTVLHIHGGAFRIGCPEMIAPFAAALAERCGVTVLCPAYRLAPEHPFPAGLNDCHAVLATLVEGPVILSGDSAGGGLAASLAADPPVTMAGLALLSPWLDLTVSSASYAANAGTDPLFSAESAEEAARLYLQGVPTSEPHTSPLLGPITEFPPTYINSGAGEVLLDDARGLHAKLRSAGIPAQLDVIAGMDHVAATRDRTLPGAAQAFYGLATFIDAVLGES